MSSAPLEPEETGAGANTGAAHGNRAKGRALVLVTPAASTKGVFTGLGRSHGYVAGGVALVMGLGFVVGTQAFASKHEVVAVAQAAVPVDTTMDVLHRVQDEVRSLKANLDGLRSNAEEGRQTETIRGLKKSVDLLKQDLEGVKAASTGAVGQLGAKIDRLDRDPGPKLAEISARLDRLDREPPVKVAELTTRLDRIERQVASADATGSIPPAPAIAVQAKAAMPPQRVAQAAPVPAATPVSAVPPSRPEVPRAETVARADAVPARPDPAARPDVQPRPQDAAARPATVEGWMLRDVYGGMALVEGRSGGLREVAPGEYLPGVGEIRSIERRGRGWVVVTSRGIIQADNRW